MDNSRHKKLVPVVTVSILLAVIVFIASRFLSSGEDAIYIAVIGPMSGDSYLLGDEIVKSIQLRLDEVNRAGGINGKKVEILVFDDQGDPDVARAQAEAIVQQNKALIVIGHAFSSTSIQGGEVYRAAGLPAIDGAASADRLTADNPWYFRTIFTNSSQAAFLAEYAIKIMGHDSVYVVADKDAYSSSLEKAFVDAFRAAGGDVERIRHFDSAEADIDQRLEAIVAEMAQTKKDPPDVVFIAAQYVEAEKIITMMKRQDIPYPVIGGDTIGDPTFVINFENYPEEQTLPGYFSNGIHATTPMIFDVAGEEALRLRETYMTVYGEEPGWVGAMYYDAATTALEAIKRAGAQGEAENLAQERKLIRDTLASFNSIETAIKGTTGLIYFDEQNNIVQPVTVGMFSNQRFISADIQLRPAPKSDLGTGSNDNSVVFINKIPMRTTHIVYTGIDINEIRNLDTKTSTYVVDFYLWFRYKGQVDAENIQFINAIGPVNLGDPIAQETIDGTTYRAYRVIGTFKGEFTFQDYPFDQQQVEIMFRHRTAPHDELIYVVDKIGMRDTQADTMLTRLNNNGALKLLTGWQGRGAGAFQDIFVTDSTLGNPRLFNTDNNLQYSRYNAFVQLQRNSLEYIIKSLLPLLIALTLAYLAFYLPIGHSNRFAAGTSALLTTALFHFNLISSLPQVGYTVAIEYFFYAAYTLSVLVVLIETISIKLENQAIKHSDQTIKDRIELQRIRLNIAGRIIYPAIILLVVVWLAWRYAPTL